MTAVLETADLTKRFGRRTALRECEMSLPAGKVVGLVGPNGAGKTTLLQLAIGLRAPTAGHIAVLGLSPTTDTVALLARAGFVGQDRPLYPDFTTGEMLEAGGRLNARWDAAYATARLRRFGIALDRRIRTLSTGQRAQVALALALGKRPELLLLDEPVANLDPVARLELLEELMGAVAAEGITVVLSANALADVERVCDHLVILVDGRVRLAGDTEQLVGEHVLVVGPRLDRPGEPPLHATRRSTRPATRPASPARRARPVTRLAWRARPATRPTIASDSPLERSSRSATPNARPSAWCAARRCPPVPTAPSSGRRRLKRSSSATCAPRHGRCTDALARLAPAPDPDRRDARPVDRHRRRGGSHQGVRAAPLHRPWR